jgi:hypothetical protein
MLGLAEEVTFALELAAVHGCVISAPQVENQQSAATVRYMLRRCYKKLSKMEEYASCDGSFLVTFGSQHPLPQITVADCVVFATLRYARELFWH